MTTQPVLILGAGINGASLARELALNHVSCWLVEKNDIASGATSKSSRLIHGGLRYLEYGEFRLVREALRERDRLLRLAPQFVRPLRFAVPICRRNGGWGAAMMRFVGIPSPSRSPRGLWLTRAGLRIYDWFSRRSPLPSHSVARCRDNATPRVAETYRWVCCYADAQMRYPERYTVALLRDAQEISEAHGLDFRVFTHHEVCRTGKTVQLVDLRRQDGLAGSPADDTPDANRYATQSALSSLDPPLIVNATGAWGDATLDQLHVPSRRLFGGTKGSHFLVASAALREALGDHAVYAETSDGRFVFVLPFGTEVLIGTTDEVFSDDPHQAVATPAELSYLSDLVREVFPGVQLVPQDIVCHYSGVRPLPFAENLSPGAVSRDHHVELSDGAIPVLTLIGGKLTTSRQLGEQVADIALQRLGLPRVASSRERVVPGGEAFPSNAQDLERRRNLLAHKMQCEPAMIQCLDALCGKSFESVMATLTAHERRAITGTQIPRGFVRWVLQNEWVRCLPDLVERRLMLVLTRQLSTQTLRELAQLMVEEDLIDDAELETEMTACRRRLTELYGYRWEVNYRW